MSETQCFESLRSSQPSRQLMSWLSLLVKSYIAENFSDTNKSVSGGVRVRLEWCVCMQ